MSKNNVPDNQQLKELWQCYVDNALLAAYSDRCSQLSDYTDTETAFVEVLESPIEHKDL